MGDELKVRKIKIDVTCLLSILYNIKNENNLAGLIHEWLEFSNINKMLSVVNERLPCTLYVFKFKSRFHIIISENCITHKQKVMSRHVIEQANVFS